MHILFAMSVWCLTEKFRYAYTYILNVEILHRNIWYKMPKIYVRFKTSGYGNTFQNVGD